MPEDLDKLQRERRGAYANMRCCHVQLQNARRIHAMALQALDICRNEERRLAHNLSSMLEDSHLNKGQQLDLLGFELCLDRLEHVQSALEESRMAVASAQIEVDQAVLDVGTQARLLDLAQRRYEAISADLMNLKERESERLLEQEWLARI